MRGPILLGLVASLVLGTTATAFQLPFDATVTIQFHVPPLAPMPPLVTQVRSSTAAIQLTPGGALARLQLAQQEIATTGLQVGPLSSGFTPVGGFEGTFGAWPTPAPPLETFARGTSGRIGGVVRVLGLVRVCLFAPSGCPGTIDIFIPLAHPTAGSGSLFYDAAVGWQGTWFAPGGFNGSLTVKGAPWTTGTVSAGGGVTAMGFAEGPAALPGSTARNGGRLNLVTPIFISSSIETVPSFPGIATLAIRFTGDPPACANGIDDDGDGLVDYPDDPGCQSFESTQENPQCQDGIDNDGDGKFDFDGGASANHGVALGPPDPNCTKPYRNSEKPSCGLGAEVVMVLPLWRWLRRRGAGRMDA
jgi:hypothetical protein